MKLNLQVMDVNNKINTFITYFLNHYLVLIAIMVFLNAKL